MRSNAPSVLGFWFWQSDKAKFGAGASSVFQGESISVFCQRANQIDFSDISEILRFDRIVVRHPTTRWNGVMTKRLVNHIIADLAFDGLHTKIRCSQNDNLLNLDIA
jgi:hypothetical protein